MLAIYGSEITILAGDGASDRITLLDYKAPGKFTGPQTHFHASSTEWFYVVEGELTFEVDGQSRSATAGSFVEVVPGVQHRWWNATDEPVHFVITYDRPGMGNYFRELATNAGPAALWPSTSTAALGAVYDTFLAG